MVLRLFLLTLGFASSVAFAQTWTESLTFPTTDVNGVVMQATELRQFAYLHEYTPVAALYAGGGFFGEQDNGRGLQIYVLDAAPAQGGKWKVDQDLDDFCAGLSMQPMCFETTDSMQTISFTKDATGDPVSAQVLTIGPFPNGDRAKSPACTTKGAREVWTFSKNNTDGKWYGDNLACDHGDIRAYSWVGHTDTVTGQQYVFAGEGDTGLYTGQLNPNQDAGQHPILWATTPEWFSSSYVGPPVLCHSDYGTKSESHRITGFAEVVGLDGVSRAYMTECFTAYVRIDGPTPGIDSCGPQQVDMEETHTCVDRWQPYWFATAQNVSADGLRGLTALTEDVPQDMAVGYEGPPRGTGIFRLPALCPSWTPACGGVMTCGDITSPGIVTRINDATCATNEYLWPVEIQKLSGITSGSTTEPRNRLVPYVDSNGVLRRILSFDMGVNGPAIPPNPAWSYMYMGNRKLEPSAERWADGAFLIRSQGGTYILSVIPPLFPTPEEGTRDCSPSPFASEKTAVYCGGFDVSGAAGGSRDPIYWCSPGQACPLNPPPLTDTYNTAWVARYGN